jgi:S1-C subfamily serine protease
VRAIAVRDRAPGVGMWLGVAGGAVVAASVEPDQRVPLGGGVLLAGALAGVLAGAGARGFLGASKVTGTSAVRQASASVAKLFDARTGRTMGTGWMAAPGQVVTNRHVVQFPPGAPLTQDIELRFANGRRVRGALQRVSPDADLALIATSRSAAPPLPLAARGSEGTVLGHPLGGGLRSRTVTGSGRMPHRSWATVFTGRGFPGDSGAPIVNDAGSVIAVAAATEEGGRPEVLAVNLATVRRFLHPDGGGL